MRNNNSVRMIASYAILIALTVALAFISNYVTIATVNINLALIPIVVGACLYGPLCGLALGVVDGIIILTAPGTASFLAFNIPLTILLCCVKTGVAGLVSGFVFKALKKKNTLVAVILASLVVPIINTGIFLCGVFLWFLPLYQEWAGDGVDVIAFVFTATLTVNFLIEFVVNCVLSPAVHTIVTVISKKMMLNRNDETTDDSVSDSEDSGNETAVN